MLSPATVSSSVSLAVQKMIGTAAVSGWRPEQPGHLESAHLAHHDVEQNQRIAFGVHAEGLFGAVRRIDFVTLDFEIELKNLAEGFLVVHHKDFVLCHNCYGLVSASKST